MKCKIIDWQSDFNWLKWVSIFSSSNIIDSFIDLTDNNDLPQELVPHSETHHTGGGRGLHGLEGTHRAHISYRTLEYLLMTMWQYGNNVEAFMMQYKVQLQHEPQYLEIDTSLNKGSNFSKIEKVQCWMRKRINKQK